MTGFRFIVTLTGINMVNLVNKKVRHKVLGIGTVIAQDEKYITVSFKSKKSKFMYPVAFEKFLIPDDPSVLDAIKVEAATIKTSDEASKAVREDAEERNRLKELKKKAVGTGKKAGATKTLSPVKRTSGQTLTYLVFQGDTYEEEKKGQFIWAPKFTKSGNTCHHWDRLMDVRENDVIFHCAAGYIQAISRAKSACVDSARPDDAAGDWKQWEKDGRRVDCDYYVLKKPLKYRAYKDIILHYCNVKYSPFDKNGDGNLGYLFYLNKNLAAFFLKEIVKNNSDIKDLDFVKFLLV
jgi:hypothetical protein